MRFKPSATVGLDEALTGLERQPLSSPTAARGAVDRVERRSKPGAPRDCTGFTGVGPWNLPYIDCVCRLGLARGVINMAGRYQGFHSLNTGNIEIFWRADGWCWWSRAPGCPSESAPVGPFLTSTDAYLNANGGACLIPRPARIDRVA